MKIELWEENMKQALLSALRNNNSWELRSILSWKPIVYHFGEDFAELYMQERKDRNIFLYSLRLTQDNYDSEKHKNYAWYLKQAQYILYKWKLDYDWIFLWEDRAVWFDMKNLKTYFLDEVEAEKYRELFEEYWNV